MKGLAKLIWISWIVCFLLVPLGASAKINFQSIKQEKIDLDQLKLNKDMFFDLIIETIEDKSPGLGNFGRVSFIPCHLRIDGSRLYDLKTMEGREIKFISNPTCDQVVIRKVLGRSYGYRSENLTSYTDKKCVFAIQQSFSPILEYYTIKYEERFIKDCPYCDSAEKSRLTQIGRVQQNIQNFCGKEQDKILQFLSDVDAVIEKTFQKKNPNRP